MTWARGGLLPGLVHPAEGLGGDAKNKGKRKKIEFPYDLQAIDKTLRVTFA